MTFGYVPARGSAAQVREWTSVQRTRRNLRLREAKDQAGEREFVYGPHHGMISMLKPSMPVALLVFWQHKIGSESGED